MNLADTVSCQRGHCGDQPETTVISTWPVPPREPDEFGTVVTIQGWIEEHCRSHAIERVLWPPHPKESS